MKMIIGGACQGKLNAAMELTGYPKEAFADGAVCDMEEVYQARGIRNFHLFIKRLLEQGEDCRLMAERLIERNPQMVIVCNELGYGVVPVDPADRRWREETGRVCTRLAKESEQVIRVVCGIGTRIKG